MISVKAHHFGSNTDFCINMIYGFNAANERLDLWSSLMDYSTNEPWFVLGDFNIVRCPEEKISLHPPGLLDMMDFNTCLASCHLDDMTSTGSDLSWTNKQDTFTRVWSKLDRALANPQWYTAFPTSCAHFLEMGLSDHSHVLVFAADDFKASKRYSFLNSWVEHLDFLKAVQHAWRKETELLLILNSQRAKLRHVQQGDSCTKYFFAKINERKHQQVIGVVKDMKGVLQEGLDKVSLAFQEYYFSLLACFQEIKYAVFGIDSESSPEIDGFSSGFYKSSWSIIGPDFTAAVLNFFKSGHMPKQANSTLISLILKKLVDASVLDYRPISCCTVFYKTISKILTSRLQKVIPTIVGEDQTAFIKGRSIFENIMLSQSLVKGYTRKNISPRCLIKVDIRKAFDTFQ
ncbi:uncharacterized protein LOC141617147 [Silene latifolia]|uniref:uncharacterized protein LOC141617147 n=1 Tax=Silene latifolia TaxID=37657 RepID=UPI003D789AD0